jgi:hypothetical protein
MSLGHKAFGSEKLKVRIVSFFVGGSGLLNSSGTKFLGINVFLHKSPPQKYMVDSGGP